MKVRCVNVVDWLGRSAPSMSGITVGKTYAVVSLSADQSGVSIRVITNDGSLAIYPMRCFEIANPALSTKWTASSDAARIQLAPEEWHPGGRFISEDAEYDQPLGATAADVRALADQIEDLRQEADPEGETPLADIPTLPDVYELESALKPELEAFGLAVQARRPDVAFTLSQRPTIHYWSSSLLNLTSKASGGDLAVAGAVLDIRGERPLWTFHVVTGDGPPIAQRAVTPTWREIADPSWSRSQLGSFLAANLEAALQGLPHVTFSDAD